MIGKRRSHETARMKRHCHLIAVFLAGLVRTFTLCGMDGGGAGL
jgi:hypothetical protein